MKRYIKIIALSLSVTIGVVSAASCYGKFQLTRKVYVWNGTLGTKWVNSIVMWALFIIPVYEVVGVVDLLVLNTIEFWTGNNPMTMKAGEKEVKTVSIEGQEYEITATMNRLDIKALSGNAAGKETNLIYKPEEKSWFVQFESGLTKIAQVDNHSMELIYPE